MAYPAKAVRRWLKQLPVHQAPMPEAKRSALLVIDMQEYFRGIAEPIIDTVASSVLRCRELGVPVVFTQHGHDSEDDGMLSQWWDDLIIKDTPEHALLDVLEVGDDPVVAKTRYDAFYKTELEVVLRASGARDVAIAGVMTNLCVETTARTAFVRDLRVRLLVDATAAASEEMHLASLKNLAYGFAHAHTAHEWLDAF